MTGDGKGADLFACTGGAVKRYWMTTRTTPSGGALVADSSCSYVNGMMSMSFRRPMAAEGPNTVAITPGADQTILFARGGAGSAGSFAIHPNTDRNGQVIDFATLSVTEASKKSAEAALWMHLICMILCFGALLPWGVALANRTRGASGGAWFKLHRGFQTAGWCIQLIGFAMALWHSGSNGGGHFGSSPNEDAHGHMYIGLFVVILTTLQPVNAYFRPHPTPGQSKSIGRWIFELVHKGCGYIAVVLGIFNMSSGIRLLSNQSYDDTVNFVALVLTALGVVPVACFWLISCLKRENFMARICVGLVGGSMQVSQDSESGVAGAAPIGKETK